MTGPTTEVGRTTVAGRWLLRRLRLGPAWEPFILDIEAEAVANERARITEAVEGQIADFGGRCIITGDGDREDFVCETHQELLFEASGCERRPRQLLAVLAIIEAKP